MRNQRRGCHYYSSGQHEERVLIHPQSHVTNISHSIMRAIVLSIVVQSRPFHETMPHLTLDRKSLSWTSVKKSISAKRYGSFLASKKLGHVSGAHSYHRRRREHEWLYLPKLQGQHDYISFFYNHYFRFFIFIEHMPSDGEHDISSDNGRW